MPGSYTLFPEYRFVYSRLWGSISEAVLLAHAQALRSDPRFHPSFAQLVDLSAVSGIPLTTAAVRRAGTTHAFGAGSRRAVVAVSDFSFGMARMFELLREGAADEVKVFRDIPSALTWLDERAPPAAVDFFGLPPDWLYEQE